MFGFFTRSVRPSKPRAPRSVCLGLEPLETRYAPASMTTVTGPPPPPPPVTLTMAVAYGSARNLTLSGHLANAPTVSNQAVAISGQATGTATTDVNGDYTIALTATALGEVDAASNGATASVMLTDPALFIDSFSHFEGSGGLITFSGHVTREGRGTAGLWISLYGGPSVTNQYAAVQADGSFSVTLQFPGQSIDNGTVWAKTVDAWGTVSDTAYDYLIQTGV